VLDIIKHLGYTPGMKKLIYLTAAILILVVIGLVQNYYNNPVRGCREYYTGTNYRGYNCNGVHKYQLR